MTDCDVLIVGAGPVGLTLAIDLGRRGIKVMLVEQNLEPLKWPKMERCNARTMEIFRHMELAEEIRKASQFTDVPMDVFGVTALNEEPLVHLVYPSVTECKRQIEQCGDGSLNAEPYQLISQYTLEPLLRRVAEREANIEVRFETRFLEFTQADDCVRAEVETRTGTQYINAQYLVGTDGGNSTVRKQLGTILEGQGRITTLRQIFFRSDGLFDSILIGKGRHYWFPDATLVVQDDLRHFAIHTTAVDERSAEQVIRDLLGDDLDVDVLNETPWRQNLLLVRNYSNGRVFLAGDSAHLVIPIGGLGLNTGIGDAIDLSWKLGATLQGWGGPELLSSYEAERRPVAIRNREASGRAARAMLRWRSFYSPLVHEDSPAGKKARKRLIQEASAGLELCYGLDGVEFGYQYLGSPVICEQPGSGPQQLDFQYRPSTSPGCRLPHAWVGEGESIQDRIGPGYNLLDISEEGVDWSTFESAFCELGAPVHTHQLESATLRRLSINTLMIVRPDLHIAWAGSTIPDDVSALVSRMTGN